MNPIRHWSIKSKFAAFSLISVGVALALSSAGVIVNEIYTMRAFKMESLQSQTEMLAFNSTAVLSFRDAPAARNLLASLQSQPTVEFACLYDADGRPLATYPAGATAGPAPAASAADQHRFTANGQLEVCRRVVDHGEPVGTLYLRANADDLRRQLAGHTKIVMMVALLALIASLLLADRLQRSISGPILRLANTATTISAQGDYSIRVPCQSEDELGLLCTEFNRMLDRVQRSDQALKKAHDELEDRVAERTAELRAEIDWRARTQAELVQAKNAAEAANVAKSQFLANMSHEIRTPLNAILGFTDLLRKGAGQDTPAEREDFLNTIHTSGKHLLSLINDILDLSKIEADRMEIENIPCSPQQIMAEILSVMRVKAMEKGLSLDCHWQSGVPETICTDPARLRQLLMNLLSNAVKFTHAGGVQILAQLVPEQPRPHLVIQVVDSGVGIPAEKFEAIFDPFVQADSSVTRQFGGTGLGLTISRRIAQSLGGNIAVASEVGKGTTFTVTIATGPLEGVRIFASPLADALRNTQPEPDQALPSLEGVRILLVEDGETNRKLIGLVLRRAGVHVTTAENGRVGADRALGEPFDLILMDMQMPVMDGYSATTLLRQQGLDVPIIALTAHAMKGDEQRCRSAGCSGYVSKPIDADALLRTVARKLDDARQARGPESAPAAAVRPAPPREADLESTLPMDDPEFREIVADFVQRLHQQLDAMQRALEAPDLPELGRLAHWLKGTGGTAGFPAFTQPSARLEALAKDGPAEQIAPVLAELLELSQRIVVPPAVPAPAL
jgi:signal transduction histidine kinase/CheY-like chemotaxis protein/HPt (histidine-containing phosphotransfer) domain-containing protein